MAVEGVAKREFSSLGLNILDFMSGLSPSLNLLFTADLLSRLHLDYSSHKVRG